ncbi:MAG: hypothetical protein K9I68_06325 [Bacteroidales bacterium]|nr:hypothetical protein [Bacteroidales bacterium]MCF8337461.1 hypothetical protein [Bacteroidales bacterium]
MKADYKKILELIHQLPEKDIERLVNALQSEIAFKKSSKQLEELILKAPTWSASDYSEYEKARNLINKSRLG